MQRFWPPFEKPGHGTVSESRFVSSRRSTGVRTGLPLQYARDTQVGTAPCAIATVRIDAGAVLCGLTKRDPTLA